MKVKARVIVNADDFGYSESINYAILKAFDMNIISTTTLICNMPGFTAACEVAHSRDLIEKIGIHFNLSEGQPLTEPIKGHKNFYKDGQMYKSFKGHFINKNESFAVLLELQSQIDRCRTMGINPTHCDTHHHLHHSWGIGKLVKHIALKNGIPSVRLRFNWGAMSYKRRLFSGLYNLRLKVASLAKTNYFCEIRSVTPKLLMKNAVVEVMVHPVLDSSGNLTNYKDGSNLFKLIEKHLLVDRFLNFKDL